MSRHRIDPAVELPDLAALFDQVGEPISTEVDDTFFDSEDLRLARWRASLRHRDLDDWLLTLPTAESLGIDVLEVSANGPGDTVPDRLLTLAWPYALGAPLHPVARLRRRRIEHRAVEADGATVCIRDDRVRFEAGGGRGAYREVLVQAPTTDAGRGARRLRKALDALAVPELDAPPIIAVEAVDPPPLPSAAALKKRASAHDVLGHMIATNVTLLLQNLPVAFAGEDPEGVHRARVAVRRLRANLRTFAPFLVAEVAEPLRSELRWLGDLLGASRDADVLHGIIDGAAAARGVVPDEHAGLLAPMVEARAAASGALVEQVCTDRGAALLTALVGVAQAVPSVGAEEPARVALQPRVARSWRKLQHAASVVRDDPTPVHLHRLRLHAKKARYAVAALVPVAPSAEGLVDALGDLQDELGALQDLDLAHRWLTVNAGGYRPEVAFAAGQIAEGLAADAERRASSWIRLYEAATTKPLRAWL